METSIAGEIQSDQVLYRLVERANEVLVRTIGRAPEPPRGVWRLKGDDQERRIVELELLYHDESVSREFVPDELTDELELRRRVGRLWEDLLLSANRRTTNRLLAIFRAWRQEAELQEV